MAILSREEIVTSNDRPTETVPVPEWGGEVILRTLAGYERDAFEASVASTKNGKQVSNMSNIRARLVAKCLVDESGQPLFVTKGEIDELGAMSALVLDRLFDKCQKLNGMAKKDVEEMVEDFENGPSDDSTSD